MSIGIFSNYSNSNFFNSYFNTSMCGSKSSYSNSSSLSSLLGDYSTIRSGSYTKLLRAYYSKNPVTSKNKTDNTTKTDSTILANNKSTALAASELYKSSAAMDKLDFSSENIDDIYKKASEFVEDYNKFVDTADDSTNNNVLKNTVWLTKTTKAYSKLLSKAGISVGENNTLSIDETKFKSADMSTIKTIFDTNSSFAAQTGARANRIYNLASTSGLSNTSYTSSGTYRTLNAGSILDQLT